MFMSSGRGCASTPGQKYSPPGATGLLWGSLSFIHCPPNCAYRNQVSTQADRKTSKFKCCDWQRRCSMTHIFFFLFLLPLRNTQNLNSRLQGAEGWELAQTHWYRIQDVSLKDSDSKFFCHIDDMKLELRGKRFHPIYPDLWCTKWWLWILYQSH